MNIFLLVIIAFAVIIFLIRKKYSVGVSMLAGGIIMWLFRSLNPMDFITAAQQMLSQTRSYDLIIALCLVMCLEVELRSSGTLSSMVNTMERLFSSDKVTLGVMPAFLGLLPSVGGARFSAPIVEEAAKNMDVTPEDKSNINFWFRHPFEYSNPIIPGMILACSIAQVPYYEFVKYTGWLTVLFVIVGSFFILRPLKYKPGYSPKKGLKGDTNGLTDIFLALSPLVITFLLVVFLQLNASVAMLITTVVLFIILKLMKRPVKAIDVIKGAYDRRTLVNVICILYFIQVMTVTNVLGEIVAAFQAAPLPIPVILAGISFVVGILTGMSQGFVAIVMPIVAALGAGNMALAAIAMVFGVAGQMITPTHVCMTVTTDYFKSDILAVIRKSAMLEAIILLVFSTYTYLTW